MFIYENVSLWESASAILLVVVVEASVLWLQYKQLDVLILLDKDSKP